MELTIEQALRQGIAAHKEGKLQDAERLYRAILQSEPKHADANHNLGVLAVSVNKADAALPLFKTALEAKPEIDKFWLSYIDALIKDQKPEDAEQVLLQARKRGVDADGLKSLEEKFLPRISPPQELLISLLECYQRGQLDDAEKLAVSVTREFPKHEFAWKVLGAVFGATGRNSEAVKAIRAAITLSPQDAEAHYNLGVIFQELGRLDDAVTSYKQAIKLKPEYVEAHSNLGVTLDKLGRLDEAEASYKQAIALKPDCAEAHNNLGNTLKELGKLDEAATRYNQAIALKPDFAEAHNNLGNTFKELGRLPGALDSYNRAIAFKTDYAEAHYNLGITLQELGRLDKALDKYTQAIALKPDYAEAHNNLGATLQELGRFKEAVDGYRQAIALKPGYAEAHRHLTSMKNFDAQDEQYLQMMEVYLDQNISEEQRCHINFGLGKASEDLGNFEQAYIHYGEGNMLRKKLLNYDINQDVELFKQLKSTYPKIEKNSLKPFKSKIKLIPIFIVGMPRSGTTLVEQIVSSHSLVTGAGELNFANQFGEAIATGVTEANNESLLDFHKNYLNKLQNFSNGNFIVTDKMPENFRYIGLLASAFPEAKIIHVKRNPAAVCWANYKQYFVSKNIGYCYAIDDVINYYKLYENLMDFWTSTLGKRIYNLDYELLTMNQEIETRQLIDYLGLDWDENCLSPQNNTRSVATASSVQVRKKVYGGSSEQWKNFQPFLNGAFDALLSP